MGDPIEGHFTQSKEKKFAPALTNDKEELFSAESCFWLSLFEHSLLTLCKEGKIGCGQSYSLFVVFSAFIGKKSQVISL